MKTAIMLSFLLASSVANAASVGTEAAPFLKIGVGARAVAMGGAFTAIADDASAVFYNPAGPALMENAEIFLSHNQWIEELSTEHIAYVHPVSDKLTYFAGLSALLSPMMPSYDTEGNKTGSFNAVDAMYGVGAAFVEKGVTAGCFVKMVTQEAYEEKGSAYAGDIGLIHNLGRLRVGVAAQNLGSKMKVYQEEFNLPRTYRAGLAYRAMDSYWLSGEANKFGEAEVSYAVGAEGEFKFSQSAKGFLRLGYNSGRSRNTGSGIAAGLGLSVSKFTLDYAFSPFGDLGVTHRVTLALRIGAQRPTGGSLAGRAPTSLAAQKEMPPEAEELDPAAPITVAPSAIVEYSALVKNASESYEKRDYKEAFALFGKASESIAIEDARQVYVLERMGLVLVKQGNCDRAKKFYAASIKTAKKLKLRGKEVSNAYSGLAYCQEKSGKREWAAANYRAAITATDDMALKSKLQKYLSALGKK